MGMVLLIYLLFPKVCFSKTDPSPFSRYNTHLLMSDPIILTSFDYFQNTPIRNALAGPTFSSNTDLDPFP